MLESQIYVIDANFSTHHPHVRAGSSVSVNLQSSDCEDHVVALVVFSLSSSYLSGLLFFCCPSVFLQMEDLFFSGDALLNFPARLGLHLLGGVTPALSFSNYMVSANWMVWDSCWGTQGILLRNNLRSNVSQILQPMDYTNNTECIVCCTGKY